MWMQQSMESASISHNGQRNRFGPGIGSSSSSFDQARSSYMGGGAPSNANGDWKSKILESGQWLGGKVIEYGGKLARGGGSHDTIPDHMMHQPRNDGRANWMADIRNSTSSYSNTGGYNSSYSSGGGAYQNDFATERPKAYSDSGPSFSSSSYSSQSYSSNSQPPARDRTYSDKDSHRHSKKKSSKKSKKHSKRRDLSESEESDPPSESDASSVASDSDSDSNHRRSKAKGKSKKKSNQKRRESFSSSDEEESLESKVKGKKTVTKPEKAPADYSFSFDPAKLPPPPADDAKKSKKDKKDKKSRGRRQSVASSESEASDKENHRTKKVTLKSKKATSTKQETVDLLGVDFVATSVPAPVVNHASVQPDIFSQPLDPMQDLAGLNFDMSFSQHQNAQASQPFGVTTPNAPVEQREPVQHTNAQVIKKLLPENSIVDLDVLASDKKKSSNSASSAEKKTLNELQRAKMNENPHQMQPQAPLQPPMMMGATGIAQPPMTQQALMMQQQMQMQMMMQQMHLQGQPQYANAMFPPQNQGYPTQQQNNGMHPQFQYAQQ